MCRGNQCCCCVVCLQGCTAKGRRVCALVSARQFRLSRRSCFWRTTGGKRDRKRTRCIRAKRLYAALSGDRSPQSGGLPDVARVKGIVQNRCVREAGSVGDIWPMRRSFGLRPPVGVVYSRGIEQRQNRQKTETHIVSDGKVKFLRRSGTFRKNRITFLGDRNGVSP